MKNPKALSQGYSNEIFDLGLFFPKIQFAGSIIENCPIPLVIRNTPVFVIKPPQEVNGMFLLSAIFYDSNGIESLKIINNEWFTTSNNWDVEIVGPTLTIREKKGQIALQIRANPPDTITISRIKMFINGYLIEGDETQFSIIDQNTQNTMKFSNCMASHCRVGFIFG